VSITASSSQVIPSSSKKVPYFTAKLFGSTTILTIAIAFVLRYVFRCYLNYNRAAFTDPFCGAANFCAMRGWLLMHMTGGMLALLTGPWQFWSVSARAMSAKSLDRPDISRQRGHRLPGRLPYGRQHHLRLGTSVGLVGLATAWATTAGMAYYAVLKRRIPIHKEWMVRA